MSGIALLSGSFQINSDVTSFNETYVGKSILVLGAGAGSGTFVSKIDRVFDSGSASIEDAAFTSVTAATFRTAQDHRAQFQGLLNKAASGIESLEARVVKLPPGRFMVDLSNETASLFVQSNVTIRGSGDGETIISVWGADHATLFRNSESVNFGIKFEDIKLDLNRDFFSGSLGTTGILLEGSTGGSKLHNISAESASACAICISGSAETVLTNITTKDVGNGVIIADSTKVVLANFTDSGSAGSGLKLENVQSSSFVGLALDEGGSGSFVQDAASEGNVVAGFVPFIDIQIPGEINNPDGSWIQFIEGGPKNPGGGTVQAGLLANYSGTADDNWIGITGQVTGTSDIVQLASLPAFVSWSVGTGRASFSTPVEFTGGVTGTYLGTASFAETASVALVSLDGGFNGTGSIFIPSASTALHELLDLGVQSSSFTIVGSDGNYQSFIVGGNLTITLDDIVSGGLYLVDISNDGNHDVTLPAVNYHLGTTPSVQGGSNLFGFTRTRDGIIGYAVALAAAAGPEALNLTGSFTGTFTGDGTGLAGFGGGSNSGTFTGSVTGNLQLTDNQKISGVQVFHTPHDLGIKSAQFLVDWNDGNIQRVEIGAPVSISVDFRAEPGGHYILAIDNRGGHGYRLRRDPGTALLWESGQIPIPSNGIDLYGFIRLEDLDPMRMSAYVIALDLKTDNQPLLLPPTSRGRFSGSFNISSTIVHDIVDVGIVSSSFTMSMVDAPTQKITFGADITVYFNILNAGQRNTIEFDNLGAHTITLDPALVWDAGVEGTISSGRSVMTIQRTSFGNLAKIIGEDIS